MLEFNLISMKTGVIDEYLMVASLVCSLINPLDINLLQLYYSYLRAQDRIQVKLIFIVSTLHQYFLCIIIVEIHVMNNPTCYKTINQL